MVSLIKDIESSLENKISIEENRDISSSKELNDKELGELQSHFESLLKKEREHEGHIEDYDVSAEGDQEELLYHTDSGKQKQEIEEREVVFKPSFNSKEEGEVLAKQKGKGETFLEVDQSLKEKVKVAAERDQDGLSYHTDSGLGKQKQGIKEKERKFNEEQGVSFKSSSEDLASTILKNYFSEVKREEESVSSVLSSEKKLVEVANKIAERIFVSEKQADGSQEIRILLKDSVLPQTEVRVFKKDGVVNIVFQTSSQEAHRLLLDNHENLNNYLHRQLGDKIDKINVEINFFSSQAEDNTEGRSRGRRFIYEEIEK